MKEEVEKAMKEEGEKAKPAGGVSLSMRGHARKPSAAAAPAGASAGYGESEDEEDEQRRRLRAIVPLDYTDEEKLAALAPASGTAGGDLEVRGVCVLVLLLYSATCAVVGVDEWLLR